MISDRTKASLNLYLALHDRHFLRTLFVRHGMTMEDAYGNLYDDLRETINTATIEQLLDLLRHMVRTPIDLRARLVSWGRRHDERWADLTSCLLLDGYAIRAQNLMSVEPVVEGVEPPEDEFTRELNTSGLSEAEEIIRLLNNSAEDFRRTPPDYNGCLGKARIALETLAKSIAQSRQTQHPPRYDYDKERWGSVLQYLKTTAFISGEAEKCLVGVYGFISTGAHKPVGLSEQEMTRLGRNLAVSMCYFLLKLFNGNP